MKKRDVKRETASLARMIMSAHETARMRYGGDFETVITPWKNTIRQRMETLGCSSLQALVSARPTSDRNHMLLLQAAAVEVQQDIARGVEHKPVARFVSAIVKIPWYRAAWNWLRIAYWSLRQRLA